MAQRGVNINLQEEYNIQKNQIKMKTLSEYKNLLNSSIKESGITALSQALEINEEDFIKELNNSMKDKIQEVVDDSRLKDLYEKTNSVNVTSLLKQALDGNNLQKINEVFKMIDQALSLLGPAGEEIGAAVLLSLNNAKNIKQIGKNLQNAVHKYAIEKQGSTLTEQSLIRSSKLLENLGYAFQHGKFKSNNSDITARGLAYLINQNIISQSLAESLAFCSSGKARSVLSKEIKNTGMDVISTKDDEEYGYNAFFGKTDVKASNVQIHLETKENSNGVNFEMEIGFSSKFYLGQGFNSTLNKNVGIYNAGSGGTLSQAIKDIWGAPEQRYIIYNWIVHKQQQNVRQVKNLLLMREIIRLFSSAGKQDFSNFIILNGRVLSIWDLIQYVFDHDLLSGDQGIALKINHEEEISKENKYIEVDPSNKALRTPMLAAWQRSRNINTKFDYAKIQAKIHLKNLMASMTSSI